VGCPQFIREYTEDEKVVVGHQLQSCTRDVTWHLKAMPETFHENRRLVLVDTPGFDDTFSDGSEILERVSVWLVQA
jgi:hypothetical protein